MNQSKLSVQIINESKHELPAYKTPGSAGMDLRASIPEPMVIPPGERQLIHTGLKIALPMGYEAQVRPRSGLALNDGITVMNAPGTIDSDYRGEIGVILYNSSAYDFMIHNGERIAQLVIAPITQIAWHQVENLEETERGGGGFGSTGSK